MSDNTHGPLLQGGGDDVGVELVELNQSPKFPPRTQLGENCTAS